MTDAVENSQRIKVVVVACFQASRLKRVSTHDFIIFRGARELYEKQLAKKRHRKSQITVTSYKVSIEDSDLTIF